MQEAVIELKKGTVQDTEINTIVRDFLLAVLQKKSIRICKSAILNLILFHLIQSVPSLTAVLFLILSRLNMVVFMEDPALYVSVISLILVLSGFAVLNFFKFGYTGNWMKAGVMGSYFMLLLISGYLLGMEENNAVLMTLYLLMTILAFISVMGMDHIRSRLLDMRDFAGRIRNKTDELLKADVCPMEIEMTGLNAQPYVISVRNIQSHFADNKVVIQYQETESTSPE